MLRATLKSLLARKVRLILSGMAVLLGVMFVAGSFVLTDTLSRSFDNMFASAFAGTDVVVTAQSVIEGSEMEGDAVPGLLTAADVERVATVAGVGNVVGLVQADGARVIGSDGKVVTTFGPPRMGANWAGGAGDVELRDGRDPTADNEIAINAGLAKTAGLKVGDSVGVLTTQPKKMFTLVGTFGYPGGLDGRGGVQEVRFTDPVAQQLMLGTPGAYTSLDVTTAPGADPAAVRDAISAKLGAGYQAQTGQQAAAKIAGEFKTVLDLFNNILLGFAGVALFVGTFLILNTFSIIVAQRTRELALNRALGASRSQVIGAVLVEATVIGLFASVLGLAAGVGVGALLANLAADFTSIEVAGLGVPLNAVIAAFSVGLIVTWLAALLPAIRASRIPPVAALQESATPDRPLTKLTVSGALIGGLGAGLLAYGLAGERGNTLLLVGGGVLGTFIGVALLSPALARPVVSLVGRLFSWSVPGKLGRLNSGRNPRRTAITAAALMVGIALITGVNTVITSADTSLRGTAEQDVKADLIVYGQGSPDMLATYDAALVDKFAQVDGVTAVAAQYGDVATVGDERRYLNVVDNLPAYAAMFSMKMADGGPVPALKPYELLIDNEDAAEGGLKVGDRTSVQLARGEAHDYTIVGIYQADTFNGGLLASVSAVSDMRTQQPTFGFLQIADGEDLAAVKARVNALLTDNPEVSAVDREEYLDTQLGQISQILIIVQVLLGLAILIAVLGVVNTLALSVLERTRELGLLRAIGLGRWATMRMITVEAVVITLFGALLGLGVGAGLGAAIVEALKDDGLTTLTLPWQQMAVYLVLGALVGVVAAALPALRGARINILNAIAHD